VIVRDLLDGEEQLGRLGVSALRQDGARQERPDERPVEPFAHCRQRLVIGAELGLGDVGLPGEQLDPGRDER
jgi:hypothetical protein